jgi:hypothetical protein
VRYRVTAPYVTCRSAEAAMQLAALGRHQDLATSGYNQGSVLPESVPAEDIAHLLASRMIEPVPDEER